MAFKRSGVRFPSAPPVSVKIKIHYLVLVFFLFVVLKCFFILHILNILKFSEKCNKNS